LLPKEFKSNKHIIIDIIAFFFIKISSFVKLSI